MKASTITGADMRTLTCVCGVPLFLHRTATNRQISCADALAEQRRFDALPDTPHPAPMAPSLPFNVLPFKAR